jgi:D-lactate dehydrogenase
MNGFGSITSQSSRWDPKTFRAWRSFDLAIPEQRRPVCSHDPRRPKSKAATPPFSGLPKKRIPPTVTVHPPSVITVAVFDTKPYDRQALLRVSANYGIEWHFLDFRLTEDSASAAKNARAVCVFVNDQLDRSCLELLARQGVELVALRCTGFNNVDIDAAKELKLTVTRVPTYSPHAVAEHAVALLLTLNRKIHRAFNRVRELNFSVNGLVGFDLHGKTAGILGTGKIGQVTGQILRGFGMRVLAYDLFPNREWARQTGVEYVETVSVLLRNSEVISLHTPLTPETKYTIRAETIELMRPGSILINVSRGALVDTKALIKALKSGRLAGVGLDVYEEEEGIFFEDLSNEVLHDDELARLLTFPNVLITSHQAFLTREALNEIACTTVANIAALAVQEPFVDGSVVT